MRVVSILNQKGGVAKTTTAVNLGAALALAGRRVLLIDTDPQANLTDHLGVDPAERGTSIYDVLTDNAPIADGIVATSTPGLYVLPADPDLAAAEQELATEIAREMRLAQALAAPDVRTPDGGQFDYVLIDCPPSLGLLSLNAMAASDELIVTVQTEYFAMRGLGSIDQIVEMVRKHVNPRLKIAGILPTLVNPVTRLAREVIEEIRGHYGDVMFNTRIRSNVRLAEAPGHQQHIFEYDPTSAGAEDYTALAVEYEARVAGANTDTNTETDTDTDTETETETETAGIPSAELPSSGDNGSSQKAIVDSEPDAAPPVLQPVVPPARIGAPEEGPDGSDE